MKENPVFMYFKTTVYFAEMCKCKVNTVIHAAVAVKWRYKKKPVPCHADTGKIDTENR